MEATMDGSNNKNTAAGLEQLIGRLKYEDSRYAQISRIMQIVYWIFIPVYLFMAIRNFSGSGDYRQLISGGFKILAFLIFALFFGNYFKEYKYVNYALPTLMMLKKAAYRYKPFQGRMIWIALAMVFLDIGLFYPGAGDGNMIKSQVLFAGAILLAIIAGLFLWYIRYKPLRDDALQLIAEIEGN